MSSDSIDTILVGVGYFVGWAPWFLLFLSQWKRNLLPCVYFDEIFGKTENPPGLRGTLKYMVIIGGLALWMNFVMWISLVPSQVFKWQSFPRFCIIPRTFKGFLMIHHSCWHHLDFMHFGSNNFGLWTLGPLIMSYNRRTFFSSTFFTGVFGGFLLWLCGPAQQCIMGFSGILFGWFGVMAIGLFLECPPRLWRVAILLIVGFVLGGSFMTEVIKGDDQEGVSWHGHFYGFISGLIYGYLRFRRNWFLCVGFEDRVRPLGNDNRSFLTCLGDLLAEFFGRIRASGQDICDILRCRPPADEAEAEAKQPQQSSGGGVPAAQAYGGPYHSGI